jgi:DNA-binding NtrC family response regulator
MASILLMDRDEALVESLLNHLGKAGHKVTRTKFESDMIEAVARVNCDVVLASIDVFQPESSGFFTFIKDISPEVKFIVMTRHCYIWKALEIVKSGAWDYITKPISLQMLMIMIDRALEDKHLKINMREFQKQATEKYRFGNIITNDDKMLRAIETAKKAADNSDPVLITGEAGTGRHLLAKTIHNASHRAQKPFLSVDFTSFSSDFIDKMLFGFVASPRSEIYDKSGLNTNVRGFMEQADRGTLLLNEISCAPANVQEKLSEFMEYSLTYRIGSGNLLYADTRLIATTSRDLREAIKMGRFPYGLFDQLGKISLYLPPLRDRKDDIPLLAHHLINLYSQQCGKQIRYISDQALSILISCDWLGNVRELKDTIRFAIYYTDGDTIYPENLPYWLNIK